MIRTSKLNLREKPTLSDFQQYVGDLVQERGFTDQTLAQTFMLFLEECGEMAKAVRKSQGLRIDAQSKEYRIDLEIADVFIYLLRICNDTGVDLEKAFRDKEEINKQRSWG